MARPLIQRWRWTPMTRALPLLRRRGSVHHPLRRRWTPQPSRTRSRRALHRHNTTPPLQRLPTTFPHPTNLHLMIMINITHTPLHRMHKPHITFTLRDMHRILIPLLVLLIHLRITRRKRRINILRAGPMIRRSTLVTTAQPCFLEWAVFIEGSAYKVGGVGQFGRARSELDGVGL